MPRNSDRSLAAFLVVIVGGVIALAVASSAFESVPEELAAHIGKWHWLRQAWESGAFPSWWIDGFLGGFSAVSGLGYAIAMLPYWVGSLFFSRWLPDEFIFQAVALGQLALGAVFARACVLRLNSDVWAAGITGIFYFVATASILQAGTPGALPLGTLMLLVPLAFLAVLRIADRGEFWDGVLFAVIYSAAILCCHAAVVILTGALMVFVGWLFMVRPKSRSILIRGLGVSVIPIIILGLLPLLPVIYESQFLTAIESGQPGSLGLEYSAKTGASWFDRGGELFAGLPVTLSANAGSFYLGIFQILAVAAVVFRSWRDRKIVPVGLRIALGIALFSFWLSFGSQSVISGHFAFLNGARALPDWSISLPWLALILPAAIIWWMLPVSRFRLGWMILIGAVYYFVPGFRWVTAIIDWPLLRAPDGFWIATGILMWCVASGIGLATMCRQVPCGVMQKPAWAIVLILITWDVFGTLHGFFSTTTPSAAVAARVASINSIAKDTATGRVLAISGSHWTQAIPARTGRGLVTDALHPHWMQLETGKLAKAPAGSVDAMRAYFSVSGISHVVIENTDDEQRGETERWFGAWMRKHFESPEVSIFASADALFPGFFANHVLPLSDATYGQVLDEATRSVLVIEDPNTPLGADTPNSPDAPTFERAVVERINAGKFDFQLPGKSGAIVLSQAWHPHWRVFVDGSLREIRKAAGAFPSVRVSAVDSKATFEFVAPRWFGVVFGIASFGWVVAILFLIFSPWLRGSSTARPDSKILNSVQER